MVHIWTDMTKKFALFGAFFNSFLCFCHSGRHFEVDTLNSGFRYPTKSKDFRYDIPSLTFCASYCVLDNAPLFSYNHLNETCMTYSEPICAGDSAEPSREEMIYRSEAVGSCEETPCSGKYTMKLCNAEVKVKCEHDSHGHKWTVLQQRQDGGFDFDKTWNEYKNGFGDLDSEFWIGNHAVHCLTKNGARHLRIQFVTASGANFVADYKRFKVESENNKYKSYFASYLGTADDKLSQNTGGKFSTKDQDNDVSSTFHCGERNQGGWWYHSQSGTCGDNWLNSMRGFYWGGANSGVTSIKTTKMMLK